MEPTQSGKEASAPSDFLWGVITKQVWGAHLGDLKKFHSTNGTAPQSRAEWRPALIQSYRYMAFRSLARRIDHRPIMDDDARDMCEWLYPKVCRLGSIDYDELLNAIRILLDVPLPASFNTDPSGIEVQRALAFLPVIAGSAIEDRNKMENLRPEVASFLKSRGITEPLIDD